MATSDERRFFNAITTEVDGGNSTDEDRQCDHCGRRVIFRYLLWKALRDPVTQIGHDPECFGLRQWAALEDAGYTVEPPPSAGGGPGSGASPVTWARADITWDNAAVTFATLTY